MGFTKVRICNPVDLRKLSEVELMADSGALFTAIPRALLEELGLKPIARRRLRVFRGSIVERDTGAIVIEYGEARAGVIIVFGKKEDLPILGVTALESLGYQLDPVTKKLKPVELLMI